MNSRQRKFLKMPFKLYIKESLKSIKYNKRILIVQIHDLMMMISQGKLIAQKASISVSIKWDSPLIKRSEPSFRVLKDCRPVVWVVELTWAPSISGTWHEVGGAHWCGAFKSWSTSWPPNLKIQLLCSLLIFGQHWKLFWKCQYVFLFVLPSCFCWWH